MAKSNSTPAYYTGSRDRYEANRERIGRMIYESGKKTAGPQLVPTRSGNAWTTPGAANAATPTPTPVTESWVSESPEISAWDTAQYSMSEPPKQSPAYEERMAAISSDPLYNQYVEMGMNTVQPHDLTAQANTKYLTPEATQAYYAVLGRDGAAAAADFLDVLDAYTAIEQQRIAYDQQERERLARIAEENRKAYGLTGDEEAELLRLRDGSYFGADDPLYQQYVAMGLNAAQPTDLGALEQTEYLTPDAMQAYYAVLGRDGADAAAAFLDAVKSGTHPDVAEMVADGERYRELRDRALSYGYQDEGDFGDRLARSFRLLPEDASGAAAEYLTENLAYGLGSSVEGALDFLAAGGANAAAQIGEWFGADTDALREWAERVAINELAEDRQGRQEYWGAGDAMAVAGDVAGGIGGMLPTMALGALAAPAGMAYMGVSSAGQSMSDALSQGADINRAMVYGALSGVLSAATEKIVGGVPFLGGGVLDDALRSLGGSSRMAGLFKTATDVLGEGAEEWLESAVSPYLERVYSEEQRGKNNTEIWNENEQERLYSFLIGSLTSAVLNGAASVSGRVLSSGEQQQIRQEVEAAIAQNEADLSQQHATPNADATQAQIAQNRAGLADVLPEQSANIPAAQQTALQVDTEAIGNEAVDFAIQQRAAELAQGNAQTGVDPVAAIDPATLPADPLAPDSMTPEQRTNDRIQAAAEWRAEQEPEHQELVQREQEAVRKQEARADTLGTEENSRRFAAQDDGDVNPTAPPEVTAGKGEVADTYAELQQKHGTLPHGEIPTRDINVPSRDAQGGKVSLSARTIMESDAPDDFVSALENEVVNGSFSYFESTNKDATEKAKRRIEQDGAAASLNAWERNFTGEPLKTGASLKERRNALRGVDKEDIALAIELYKSALAAKDYQLAQKLAVEIAAAGNQSGQVVQAMSLIKRMTSDGQLYYLQLVVDRMAKEVQARHPRRKFNISINEELQQNLLQAKGQEEIDAAVDAIKQNIADQVPATFLDKWNAWRYLSMLGNPKTHLRNTFGNGVMFAVQRIKNGIASGIEALAQKAGLINERSTTFLGKSEADNALRSFASGDYDVMADEVAGNKSHDYFSRTTQDIMNRRTVFKSKVFRPVEKVRRLNNNLLEAEDKIFSKAHYIRALAQYLKANGWTAEQIQSGTNEANVALQKAREKAIQEAQRATFRDASETAKWLNRSPNAAKFVLTAVMPFTKTPINVLKRGLEYSPVGLIRGIKNSIFDVQSGKVSATEAIDRMAAGLTGAGIVALGWLLGSLDVLTGGDDENDDVQKQKELTGYQNYSLHIGDVYYSLDWLSPISMPLFVGVSLSQSEDIGTALGSLTGPFLEMSMLQGLNSILQSAEYGPFDNKFANMAADAAGSYVGQAIPTVSRQLASTIDGTRRDSYAVGDSKGFAKYIEQEANQLGAKIPFVPLALQPYVDAWGRTEENANFLGRAVENFLSPGYVSRDNTTDVDRFLAELVDEVGDPSLFPNTASRFVTLKQDGDPMEYNADTWTEYSQIRGQAAYDAINGLIQQPTFMMRLSPEEQAEAIKNAYEMANAIGKSGIEADVSKGWTQNKAVEAYDAGIEPSDWILFNTMADGTGASNRSAALNGMGWLSNDERSTMFDIYLPDARDNPFVVAQDLSNRSAVSGSQFLNVYDSLFADGAPTQMDAFNELRSSDLSTVQLAEIWNEIGDMAVGDGGWPSDKNPFMMAYETGIDRDDVLDIYGAFYGGRSQSQSRLLEELDDSGFTEAQKAALWEVFAEAQGWEKTWADVS